MAFNSNDEGGERYAAGGGLGVLASASLFFSGANSKIVETGELSSPSTTESSSRPCSSNGEGESSLIDTLSDRDETIRGSYSSPMRSASTPSIGVDMSSMEQAMSNILTHIASSPALHSPGCSSSCRLCGFIGASYGNLIEHLLVHHRLTILRSMHDLHLADMLRQNADSLNGVNDIAPVFRSILAAAVQSIADMDRLGTAAIATAAELAPFVNKALSDGPTAWILEYSKTRLKISSSESSAKRREQSLEPLTYPICPETMRPCTKIQVPLAMKPRPPSALGSGSIANPTRTTWSRQ